MYGRAGECRDVKAKRNRLPSRYNIIHVVQPSVRFSTRKCPNGVRTRVPGKRNRIQVSFEAPVEKRHPKIVDAFRIFIVFLFFTSSARNTVLPTRITFVDCSTAAGVARNRFFQYNGLASLNRIRNNKTGESPWTWVRASCLDRDF